MIDSVANITQNQERRARSNDSEFPEPLWRPEGTIYPLGIVGLHEEIKDFVSYIGPSHEEHWVRQFVVSKLRNLFLSIWRECWVDVFGSFSTGLYLPTSDIDVVIFGKWQNLPLITLEKALKACSYATDIKVLSNATVPIVKFTDIETGLKVDISFNMLNSVEAARFVGNQVCCFPALRHLVLTLKQFLLIRDLNEVFTGGVSSYALILMCISFLKDKGLDKSRGEPNLGSVLMDFLHFYGTQFNYKTTGISASGQFIPKDSITQNPDSSSPSPLCIDDPISPGNNVTRRSYSALTVLKAFRTAFELLSEKLSADGDEKSTILSTIIEVQPSTLEARKIFRRKALELYQLVPSFVLPSVIHRKSAVPSHLVQSKSSVRAPDSSVDQGDAVTNSPTERQIIISARGFTSRPPAYLRPPNSADALYLSPNSPPYGFFSNPVFYDTLCFPVSNPPNGTAPVPNPVYLVFSQYAFGAPLPGTFWYSAYPPMQTTASSIGSETRNVPDSLSDCEEISDTELNSPGTADAEGSSDVSQPHRSIETAERTYKSGRSASASNNCSTLVKQLAPLRLYSSELNVSCIHENHELSSSCPFSSSSMLPSSSSASSTKSKNCKGAQLMDADSPQSPPPPPIRNGKSGRRRRRLPHKNGGTNSATDDSNIPSSAVTASSSETAPLVNSRTHGCYFSSNEETEEIGSNLPTVRKTKRRCSQLHSLESASKEKVSGSTDTNSNAWSSFKSSLRRMDSVSPDRDKVSNGGYGNVLVASPNPVPVATKGMKNQQSSNKELITSSLKRPAAGRPRSNRA
ncbi:hypothetical protein Aperf_G00000052582 [Anoplocephala perfoliata]